MTSEHAVEMMKAIYASACRLGDEADDVALRDCAYAIRAMAFGVIVGFDPNFFKYHDLVNLIDKTQ